MKLPVAEPAKKARLYLRPADHGRLLSLEDLESADAQEGYRYELIRGKLEVVPIPNLSHENLLDWLRDILKNYARQHPEVFNKVLGPARVLVPELEDGVTAPEPDLACYHDYPALAEGYFRQGGRQLRYPAVAWLHPRS
jgi:Uma2 family endonuclease